MLIESCTSAQFHKGHFLNVYKQSIIVYRAPKGLVDTIYPDQLKEIALAHAAKYI